MKKILFFALLIISIYATPVSASVESFHFSDFTGDYYLSKDDEGISHLKVVESFTAEFPYYNQNRGLCKNIPFTNYGGRNVTLPGLSKDDIKVTRNGVSEPIYSLKREDDYYRVCTGTDEYVLGPQQYVFEYEFVKVIGDFEDHQDLYWDANGNGFVQRFDKVTARLHFGDAKGWTGQKWCYVGKYSEVGKERCTISEIEDGVEFRADKLGAHETLTFDVWFKPASFVVPGPDINYVCLLITIGGVLICIIWIVRSVKKYYKCKEKVDYYKGIFVKPEYQPSKKYSLSEMAEIYIGKKEDIKVAMLLEMVVKRKIEFQKVSKKKWNIIVRTVDGLREEELDLLAILNNGKRPVKDDVIEVKRHTANSKLIALGKGIDKKVLQDLKNDKLVEKDYKHGESYKSGVVLSFFAVIFEVAISAFGLMVLFFALNMMLSDLFGVYYAAQDEFFNTCALVMSIFALAATNVSVILNTKTKYYKNHTKEGLDESRYMDGLKLYIEMAEADRLKMLQSIKGADTSAEGIVKLYEKLLPYAAVFGLEESWMQEMKEYCEVREIEEPDYFLAGMTASELARTMRSTSSYISSSTVMASSGGASSSGFSGGGGGGFAGGGGGGGGGGGR